MMTWREGLGFEEGGMVLVEICEREGEGVGEGGYMMSSWERERTSSEKVVGLWVGGMWWWEAGGWG